jgi:hypothetical protein
MTSVPQITSTNNAHPTSYTPLTADQIRLITLVPAPNEAHGFSIKLQTFPRPKERDLGFKYCALSYTWGHPDFHRNGDISDPRPNRTYSVRCNEGHLDIGYNLFDFLRHTFRRGLFIQHAGVKSLVEQLSSDIKNVDWIWVDALCINQADDAEKGQQVPLMFELYRIATRVVVWFGADAEPDENVMWIVKEFRPKGRLDSVGPAETDSLEMAAKSGVSAEDWERWKRARKDFLSYFCTRRWFSRGWIIQEAVKHWDRPSPLVMCHQQDCQLSELEDLFRCFDQAHWSDAMIVMMKRSDPNWREGVSAVWPGRLLINALRKVGDWLIEGRISMLEQQPRELSLREELGLWDVPDSELELPALQDLFADILAKSRQERQLIAFQSRQADQARSREQWVKFLNLISALRQTSPQFANKRDYVYGLLGLGSAILAQPFPLDADYSLEVEEVYLNFMSLLLRKVPNLRALGQAGLRRDGNEKGFELPSWVPDYSKPLVDDARAFVFGKDTSLSFLNPYDWTNDTFFRPPPSPAVRGRVLALQGSRWDIITETFTAFDGLQPRDPASFLALNQRDHLTPRSLLSLLTAGYAKQLLGEDEEHVDNATERLQQYFLGDSAFSTEGNLVDRLNHVMAGRRIFRTQRAQFGIGPETVKIDDEVCICEGGLVPLILRRKQSEDGNFHLVGESYVELDDYKLLARPDRRSEPLLIH